MLTHDFQTWCVEIVRQDDGDHYLRIVGVTGVGGGIEYRMTLKPLMMAQLKLDADGFPDVGVTLMLEGVLRPVNHVQYSYSVVESPYGNGYDQCGNRKEKS